ncbi:MAG: MlaD family protein, partial [Pseudomonadota bacterium]
MSQPRDQSLDVERSKKGGISAIWIVPILAAIVGAAVMWQSLSSQGPSIEIRFSEAKGIEAGKTEIKHKDVVIGLVDDVRFSEDLESVVVTAQLNPEIEPYLGDTTQFWVVGVAISGTDLSGLGTLLSGS